MNSIPSKLATIALGLAWLGAQAQQPAMPERSAIEEAPFVFKGTVRQTEASNLSALAAAPDTAIVHIDEILKSPPVLEAFVNKDITVQLKGGETLHAGEHALFLTSGWLYGESIAVKEVARASAALDTAALSKQFAQAAAEKSDKALIQRLAKSVAIVTGKVGEVAPVRTQDKDRSGPRSEHDPDFWRADVEVVAVDKPGPKTGDHITVYFAHSTDEFWLKAPKLARGQESVFVLHTVPADAPDLRTPAPNSYVVLDPLDVQPLRSRDRVRSLLAAGDKP